MRTSFFFSALSFPAFVFALASTTSCVDSPTGDAAVLFPAAIELGDSRGMDNRHDYEITGPDWDTPHRFVGDLVFVAPPRPRVGFDGVLSSVLNEPAPYTAGTPMTMRTTLGAALSMKRDLEVEWRIHAVLRSTTDPSLPLVDLGSFEGIVERREGVEPVVEIETAALPDRVDLWSLELEWDLSATAPELDEPLRGEGRVEIEIPTLLSDPVAEAPRYKQAIRWSAQWAAGEWDRDDPDTKHAIAERLTRALRGLEDAGHSYGSFPRPPRDEIDDRVNVYLDFERTACGEHRGILMALIEYHGIDASWIWFRFPRPSDDFFVDGENTHYATRTIAAVGRDPQVWRMTNHIVVAVDGRIYDPTYTIVKDSWQEYEDWMFAEYCVKSLSGYDCQPNPAGWEKNDGIHPRVIFADNYK